MNINKVTNTSLLKRVSIFIYLWTFASAFPEALRCPTLCLSGALRTALKAWAEKDGRTAVQAASRAVSQTTGSAKALSDTPTQTQLQEFHTKTSIKQILKVLCALDANVSAQMWPQSSTAHMYGTETEQDYSDQEHYLESNSRWATSGRGNCCG